MNNKNKYKKYKLKYLQIKNLKGGNLTGEDINSFLTFLKEVYNIDNNLKEAIFIYLNSIKDDKIFNRNIEQIIGLTDLNDKIKSFLNEPVSFFKILKRMELGYRDLYNRVSHINSYQSRMNKIFEELNNCKLELPTIIDLENRYNNVENEGNIIRAKFSFLIELYNMFIYDIIVYNYYYPNSLYIINENIEDPYEKITPINIFKLFLDKLNDFFNSLQLKTAKNIWRHIIKYRNPNEKSQFILEHQTYISNHIFSLLGNYLVERNNDTDDED